MRLFGTEESERRRLCRSPTVGGIVQPDFLENGILNFYKVYVSSTYEILAVHIDPFLRTEHREHAFDTFLEMTLAFPPGSGYLPFTEATHLQHGRLKQLHDYFLSGTDTQWMAS